MADLTTIQKERRRFQVFSWSGALVIAAIFIGLNFIASYIPLRLDTSAGRSYSLSRGSKEILKNLDDTLVIKVMYSSQLPPVYKLNEKYLSDLLSEYKRASHGKIRLEYMDPGKSPKAKEEAMQNGVMPVQLDVRERDRREVKECFMGVAFLYADRKDSIPIIQDTENLEYEISSRLKRLLNPSKPSIGIITNSDALTFSSKPLEPLADPIRQLYDVVEVDLASTNFPNTKALWWIGPSKPMEPAHLAILKTFLSSGGVVGLLLNQSAIQLDQFRATPLDPGANVFLEEWGLKVKTGLVVDPRCDRIQIQSIQGAFRMINVIDYPYFPWASDLNRTHPTAKNLDGISFPFVSPIEITEQKPGVTYTALAKSSQLSFLDERPMDLSPVRQHEPTDTAPKGPFVLGQIAEKGSSRLLVFGSSHFIENDYPLRPANYNFFINLLDWSVQDEALIQIRSKGFSRRPLREMQDASRVLIKYSMVLLLPLLSLVIGLFVWRHQKIRRRLLPLQYQEG